MLFNSNEFLIFLPVVLLLHQFVKNQPARRNWLLLLASYVFYGWWSLWFLLLMVLSTSVDYVLGRAIGTAKSVSTRKCLLMLSVVLNLTVLFYFKYHEFFVETLNPWLQSAGFRPLRDAAAVVLPVGISFYIFQSMSYIVDVYRGVVQPPREPVRYLAYVAFFPQLVAGPIERSPHLLPQFARVLPMTEVGWREGCWLIAWGLFKKVVIADNLAPLVDLVYGHASEVTAPWVILATIAFGMQIYCDFSGYSDVARGSGRLLGFDIMLNFRFPYAAKNIQDFWSRWHISLSTWFRDYVYIPLGGNRLGFARTLLNLLIVMLLAGLWHGAGITFLLWGLLHGLALVTHRAWIRYKPATLNIPGPISYFATMLVVFIGWAFFRSQSFADLILLTDSLSYWSVPVGTLSLIIAVGFFGLVVFGIEAWLAQRATTLTPVPQWARALAQSLMIALTIIFWRKEGTPFIYFQF